QAEGVRQRLLIHPEQQPPGADAGTDMDIHRIGNSRSTSVLWRIFHRFGLSQNVIPRTIVLRPSIEYAIGATLLPAISARFSLNRRQPATGCTSHSAVSSASSRVSRSRSRRAARSRVSRWARNSVTARRKLASTIALIAVSISRAVPSL